MTRIRSIKPEFYRHVGLFEAEQATQLPLRLAFTGLFTCCDREGRFRWQAPQLKLDILPYDTVDFEAVLQALQNNGFIIQYSAHGKVYGAIPSWMNHQRPSRDEPLSEIPAPTGSLSYNQPPTQTLRLQVYARDQYRCVYCEADLRDKPRSLCLDYVIPIQQQGSYRERNLATSCKKCHAQKAHGTPTEANLPWPQGLGERVEVPSDPKVLLDITTVTRHCDETDPPLTGGQLTSHPLLTLSNNTVTPPPSGLSDTPLTGGQGSVSKGQVPNGVEREREGEREVEREKEEEREGVLPSIVAPARQGEGQSPPILTVFNFWKATLGHPQAVLDSKRKQLIQQALKWGYSEDQLREAVRGCSLTPHNMGSNERGQRYDGLHVILKNADQIDRFIHNALNPPQPQNAAYRLLEGNIAAGKRWLERKQMEVQHG